ncbi:calmodulin-regulated spectrin-associated protein 1-B isoform X2 [Gadus macrocephalus]|uniref:calmodulin-regulated spectrin-associated protein 1-B isoform X2 n=1 Tax=Gadus macrocephalus TaxID=80720 RepID=UPI0028CB1499|nr:calmodulin-regulated spectrin-associated protein 1-B isoform X2 [Gadus macrocephalus]
MDLDLCAGGDSTRRKMDLSAVAEGSIEVVPLEMYDSARAKIDANLRWLFAKAYGIDHIPEDLRDPFYTDQYDQEHIKPPVLRLLLSCELYCRVCSLILKTEQASALQSHLCVLQALSRKGLYVVESDDTPVTDGDLASMPIKMSSHMPMIDTLMMAYTVEMISIEKVVASVKRFSTFSASKELPFDLEDAMLFWINKVNMKMREYTEREHKVKQHPLESPGHQKSPSKWYWKLVPVRYRREHGGSRLLPFFPVMEDLMKDVCDGAALLSVVHYYCPDVMKLEDICLKEVTSMADSLYNLQLLKEFSSEYLNKSFYLSQEDMLYSPLVLKHNVMVFIAELFWWFETVKPEFVQPKHLQEFKDAQALAQPKCSRPTVPISNATKRSFLASPGIAESQSNPEACSRYFLHPEESDPMKGSASFSPSHPLLPLRQRQQKTQADEGGGLRNRSNSLTQMEGPPRGSVIAWPDKRQRPMSSLNPYLMDGEADLASGDSVSLARSISKDSLASNILHVTPKHQAAGLHPQPGHHPMQGLHSQPPRRVNGHGLLGNVHMDDEGDEDGLAAGVRPHVAPAPRGVEVLPPPAESDPEADGFFLEPLTPAVLRPAKEKSVCLNKEDECGEGPRPSGRGSLRRGDAPSSAVRRKTPSLLNRTFASGEEDPPPPEPPQGGAAAPDPQTRGQRSSGFFLHVDSVEDEAAPEPEPGPERDPPADEDDDEDLDEALTTKDPHWQRKAFSDEEEESAKLREDMKVKEHVDKEDKEAGGGGSGRSSPCLSTHSQASSVASSVASCSVRMTSFAERRAHHQRFGSNHDLRSSASSSQRTTPDGSECSGPLASSWRMKRDQSPSSPLGARGGGEGGGGANMLASELVQLHMQLEEKRRAIEHQKKKMEVLSARQRQKLGKAAFLHIVKKGGGRSDTLPNPLKADLSKDDVNGGKDAASKDDFCVEALRAEKEAEPPPPPPVALETEKKGGNGGFHPEEELDLNECNRSIELLNDAIGSIQQQMMQLSFQQEMLMKQNVTALPAAGLPPPAADKFADPNVRAAVHYVEATGAAPVMRKPPKLSSARGPRTKPSELKIAKETSRPASRTLGQSAAAESPSNARLTPGGRSPRDPPDSPRTPAAAAPEPSHRPGAGHQRSASFRLNDEDNMRQPTRLDPAALAASEVSSSSDEGPPGPPEPDAAEGRRREGAEELQRSRAPLIEVDLSGLGDPEEEGGAPDVSVDGLDGEQKAVLGFFFKDEQKAEDELAKKRAAFLLKQQKKAEEARLRKYQLEAESELKREEARRKADEDQRKKEEEKTRRELIKQEYLRRKQQELLEEQGLARPKLPKLPKTPKPKQKARPKSIFREESASDKCSSSMSDNLISAQSGSSLSLASAATNEADSVNSGGAGSQRCDSVESFPGSRNPSRMAERDWDNGSTASSITSMAEYTGPKLFKEPSAKSNKAIIHNAISHCCLAGKVNEPQKNQILEELERSDSNHLLILFRDGGCQFRSLYTFVPDTEEMHKLTGSGPKSITKKMIDKMYKYSSDRKQFTAIPAKTVSVSVDALTIHNHLWQAKRGTVPKKSAK